MKNIEVKHLLSEDLKISSFNTEKEFIDFTNTIINENGDSNEFSPITTEDCKDYINEYCDNLEPINF